QPRRAVVEGVDFAYMVEVDDDLPVNAAPDLWVELAFEFGQRRVLRPEFTLRRGRADQAPVNLHRRDLIDVQNQNSILRAYWQPLQICARRRREALQELRQRRACLIARRSFLARLRDGLFEPLPVNGFEQVIDRINLERVHGE